MKIPQNENSNSQAQYFSFLFTDVEGSTRLWEQAPEAMSASIAYHNKLLSNTIQAHHGTIFKTVGDGFCVVFSSEINALKAAIAVQLALDEPSPEGLFRLKVRAGLHSGYAEAVDNDYFGASLNRVARLMSAANGQQILLSAQFRTGLGNDVNDFEWRDLGLHQLKDLNEPIHLFQVLITNHPNNLSPIKSLSSRPSNLPGQLTSFVGREKEVEEICKRLRNPSLRLLTLLGPGGIGKTRLSLQIAASVIDEFDDGVFFIAIAPALHSNDIVETIATALSLEEVANLPLLERLKIYLRERKLLLVVDNFEQVIDAAPLMNELLSAAPRLKILVTSREELFIYGEQLYPLSPLNLPRGNFISLSKNLLDYSAIRLFVERVQAVNADFSLDETNAQQIYDICYYLDGLPLAIELASVRMREISLVDIHQQLAQRLDVLNRGPRDLPDRQRTMRGAIDWSFRLLSTEEQTNFIRLAIFSGAFTAEAADSITEAYYLNRLKEKSLVKQIQTAEGNLLFVLLDTLREFALEQLRQSPDFESLQEKHNEYYLKLLESSETELTGTNQAQYFKQLEQEMHNIQSALEWAVETQANEKAARMVAILWRFWGVYSRLNTGAHWVQQVLKKSDDLSAELHARVLQGAGRLALLQTKFSQARHYFEESLTLFSLVDNKQAQANLSLSLGEIALHQEKLEEAAQRFRMSTKLYRLSDNQAGLARCLNQAGRLASRRGEFSEAIRLFKESLELNESFGSTESLAIVINDLAEVYRMQGKSKEALELYLKSLAFYRNLDFAVGIAVMLHNVGQVQRQLGQLDAACDAFQEALFLLQSLEDKQAITECLAGLGAIYLDLEQLELATILLGAAKALINSLELELAQADKESFLLACHALKAKISEQDWLKAQLVPLNQVMATVLRNYLSASK